MYRRYEIYKATHPDGSRYYGLTTKGVEYAKNQHRLSYYGSGGHTSVTGLSLYAGRTKVSPSLWSYEIVDVTFDRKNAFKIKKWLVQTDPDCLNIKYKMSFTRL